MIGLGVVVALAIEILDRRVFAVRRSGLTPAGGALIGIGCLLLGGIVVAAVPVFASYPPAVQRLEIVALGERNPAALGAEVRLKRVKLDGEILPLTSFERSGAWDAAFSGLAANPVDPARLAYSWRYGVQERVSVLLATGPQAGLATVRLNEDARTLDLYRAEGPGQEQVSFAISQRPDPFWKPTLLAAQTLALGGWLFLLVPPLPFLRKPGERLQPVYDRARQALAAPGRRLAPALSGAQRAVKSALKIALVNAAVLLLLLYLAEAVLRLADTRRRLPFDGFRGGAQFTWGNPVELNQAGFRDEEFALPKPAGTCRILALGDSLTWGQGLAAEARYTEVLEEMLRSAYPGRQFEVLNFGVPGLSTIHEKEIFMEFKDQLEADLVLVGFCFNDTQPRPQNYSQERQAYWQDHPWLTTGLPAALRAVGMANLAGRFSAALDNALVMSGAIPPWQVGLDRTYDPASREWKAFVQSLSDIYRETQEMGMPAPVFALLSQGIYVDRPPQFTPANADLEYLLRWYRQAEVAAAEIGYRTVDFEKEIMAAFPDSSMAVNALDGHPNAKANQVYAAKLFALLSADLQAGLLCP